LTPPAADRDHRPTPQRISGSYRPGTTINRFVERSGDQRTSCTTAVRTPLARGAPVRRQRGGRRPSTEPPSSRAGTPPTSGPTWRRRVS